MPTVMRIGGFASIFYSHEPNEPPHIRISAYPHIRIDRGDATIKVWLQPMEIAKSRGFRAHEIGGIVALVEEHRGRLLEAWHEYFG